MKSLKIFHEINFNTNEELISPYKKPFQIKKYEE